jgi:hypothetical protein
VTSERFPPFRAIQIGDPVPEGGFDRYRYLVLTPTGFLPAIRSLLRLDIDFSALPPAP